MNYRKPEVTYAEPKRTGLSKSEVESFAEDVASVIDYEPEMSLEDVATRLGGNLHYADPHGFGDDGSIYVHGQADFDLILSEFTSGRRDRFTLAHELGHFSLHSKFGQTPLIAHRFGTGPVEWEANWFAAAFLMPTEKVREKIACGASPETIAIDFNVSLDAARIRCKRVTQQ